MGSITYSVFERGLMIVHAPGSKVYIGDQEDSSHEIIGVITEILISGTKNHLQYKVSWWNKSVRYNEWLDALEVKIESTIPMKIGFNTQ